MSKRYFGTDGVRGTVGQPPMTVDFALRLASAAARVLAPGGGTVLIGKDTRLSGYMFEAALEAGFTAAGANVLLVGPLPTPAVAYLCRRLGADFGVVISASHNPYSRQRHQDFRRGRREAQRRAGGGHRGTAGRAAADAGVRGVWDGRGASTTRGRTTRTSASTLLQPDTDLAGLKLVVDCAHGAAYKVAPRVLADLGAEIIPIGCSPNGRNINQGCGSTQPALLATTVKGVGAQLGIALDGDGDRCVLVDEHGEVVDGDQVMYVLAADAQARGELQGPVVGTVMSNFGLEQALDRLGVPFLRAAVGDRYVMAMLKEHGGQLGGETSGHIINLARAPTGDGLVTALQVLAVMKRSGQSLSALAGGMARLPQVMVNVRVVQRIDPDGEPGVQAAMREAEAELGGRGRIVLRASGTEPVVRVMVEAARRRRGGTACRTAGRVRAGGCSTLISWGLRLECRASRRAAGKAGLAAGADWPTGRARELK
jgi:phosphoglucosamine mutase